MHVVSRFASRALSRAPGSGQLSPPSSMESVAIGSIFCIRLYANDLTMLALSKRDSKKSRVNAEPAELKIVGLFAVFDQQNQFLFDSDFSPYYSLSLALISQRRARTYCMVVGFGLPFRINRATGKFGQMRPVPFLQQLLFHDRRS